MRIVAPVSDLNEIKMIIKEGADEVYCGLISDFDKHGYVETSCLNRRPILSANFSNYRQLKSAAKLAHSLGKFISLAVNMHYASEQFSKAINQVDYALNAGIDAIIISDIGLLYKLRDERRYRDLRIHISTLGTVFNSEAIRFYKDFGATRIILPRGLTLNEIKTLASKGIPCELETFVFSDRCLFIDGFCAFAHTLTGARSALQNIFSKYRFFEKGLNFLPTALTNHAYNYMVGQNFCCLQYETQKVNQVGRIFKKEKEGLYRFSDAQMHRMGCGACALYDLYQAGIGYLKICGRSSLPLKTRICGIRFIKECLSILKNRSYSKERYVEEVKILYKKIFKINCKPSYCYQ